MKKEEIVLGADHAGFAAKEFIKMFLQGLNYRVCDAGAYFKEKRDDYPDYVKKVALEVKSGGNKIGILACGTGIGASIAANKFPGIRAALVCNARDARLSKEHNNANVLVLGGRPFERGKVRKIVLTWLKARFAGGRHARRLKKIERIEKMFMITAKPRKGSGRK
ncbi:MAG: ribose 5-phosphate isomerase B [Candidatus Omnitrophica bacterium]|nr:ribose 5-phosphate isomerase B [Candidatus Omnitrophota bacterium]